MAKDRTYSIGGVWHSFEGGPQWLIDQGNNKRRSMAAGFNWVRVSTGERGKGRKKSTKKKGGDPDENGKPEDEVWDPEVSDLLSAESLLALFRSDVSGLRPHPLDSWGYRIVHDLVAADGAEPGVLPDPDKRKAGRPRKRDSVTILRNLAIGEPAIDDGTAAFVEVPSGDMSIKADAITEETQKNLPYVKTLNAAAKILSTYDHLEYEWVEVKPKKGRKKKPRKNKAKSQETAADDGRAESYDVVPDDGATKPPEPPKKILKIKIVERKPRATGVSTNLRVKTVDLSPGLSRAIQLMIEAGRVEEARRILNDLIKVLCQQFEKIFPGAKVVGAAWHVRSGQLHLDLWAHGTHLEEVDVGIKKTTRTARLWNEDVMCHFGPGPGVCAWNRHLQALGDEARDLCPGIVDEVTRAKARAEERGAEREKNGRGPGLANRDIAIHEAFDALVSAALPDEFVSKGMDVYRDYLREFYLVGGDKKMKVQQFDEMGVSIAARLDKAKKAQAAADAACEAAEKAEKAAVTALARAEADARKKAEPIMAAARKAEAALPVRIAEAEIHVAKKVFGRVWPGQLPIAGTVDGILGEIDSGLEIVRAKAGLWDRVAPLLKRAFKSMTGEARRILDMGLEQAKAHANKPDAEISMWGGMLARVSGLVEGSLGIGKAKSKAADEKKLNEGPTQGI